jgi:signal transduction histidine kinase
MRSPERLTALARNPEQLIDLSRFTVCIVAALAIQLDPTTPLVSVEETQVTLGLYLVYSSVRLFFTFRTSATQATKVATQVIDIAVAALLTWFSGELTSPFWVFLTFTLFTGTLRWGWRGVIPALLALEVALFAVGVPDLEDGDSELNILVMRSIYFVITAVMLGTIWSYRTRNGLRLTKLASWPLQPLAEPREPWLRGSLVHAADVLGASCVVAVWRDHEVLAHRVAVWMRARAIFLEFEEPEGTPLPRVEKGFHSSVSPFVGALRDWLAQAGLRPASDDKRKLAAVSVGNFHTVRYEGHVFIFDPEFGMEDIASHTEIISTRIAYELERYALLHEVAQSARSQEREKLARNLHDSVLQDLAAANLQLRSVRALVSDEVKTRLDAVGSIMIDQQRRLRSFLETMGAGSSDKLALVRNFVDPLAASLSERWGCRVRMKVEPPSLSAREDLIFDLLQLLSEATSNAKRHGNASLVEVKLVGRKGGIEVQIQDDGTGVDEERQSLPPLSISSRVADMGGHLVGRNSTEGYELQVTIPLDRRVPA